MTTSNALTDRVDTETLEAAVAEVCRLMRWDDPDELPGCYCTMFGEFDPEL